MIEEIKKFVSLAGPHQIPAVSQSKMLPTMGDSADTARRYDKGDLLESGWKVFCVFQRHSPAHSLFISFSIMLYFSSFPEHSLADLRVEYDYIILGMDYAILYHSNPLIKPSLGGGTAGCVIANRHSEAGFSILLVERGGVGDTWASRVPLFSQAHQSTDGRVLSFHGIPQKHVNNR